MSRIEMNLTWDDGEAEQRSNQQLLFVRHGATAPNEAELRCGGDLDVPLSELGRAQAREAGDREIGRASCRERV